MERQLNLLFEPDGRGSPPRPEGLSPGGKQRGRAVGGGSPDERVVRVNLAEPPPVFSKEIALLRAHLAAEIDEVLFGKA
ncbi:hypothetical protein [Geminicoccus flavidas]|uniref:hypothetical protein n=1 Tax=Geminicoccus flavidas TaxID=2506407 RepID=UPI001357E580|nr:hypothetical protein [Geminicoccus flavidas]